MSSSPRSPLLRGRNLYRRASGSADEVRSSSEQQSRTTSDALHGIVARNQTTNNTEAVAEDNLQRLSDTFAIYSQAPANSGVLEHLPVLQPLAEPSGSRSPYPSDLEILESDSDASYEIDELHHPMGEDLIMSAPSDLLRYGSVERALLRLKNVYDEYCNVCASVDEVHDVYFTLSHWLDFLWTVGRQRGTPPMALAWRIEELAWISDVLVRVLVCRQGGRWQTPRPLRIPRWRALALPTISHRRGRGQRQSVRQQWSRRR